MTTAIIIATAVMAVSPAAPAGSQETAKIKVAVIRLDRLMNNEFGGHDRMRLLSTDKETVKAIKKLNAELKAVHNEVLGTDDEIKLAELAKQQEFLNRKLNMIKQRMYNHDPGRDVQKMAREFVIENFKDKYQLISQDAGVFDRFIYKEGVEVTDVTDEAIAKFKKYLDESIGE